MQLVIQYSLITIYTLISICVCIVIHYIQHKCTSQQNSMNQKKVYIKYFDNSTISSSL